MSKGYSIRVKICGQDFNMISDKQPKYLKSVAEKVDKSISDILSANPEMTLAGAAILSAVKFCDDSLNQNGGTDYEDKLRGQVVAYAKELERVSNKCSRLEKRIKELEK